MEIVKFDLIFIFLYLMNWMINYFDIWELFDNGFFIIFQYGGQHV